MNNATKRQMVYKENIREETLSNEDYRKILFTHRSPSGKDPGIQLVVMCLKPQEEIPLEVHKHTNQFIRVEEGEARVWVGKTTQKIYYLQDDDVIIIPAGLYHRLINPSKINSLRLYTLYSPPVH